jgi:hypothetical protein
MTIIDLRSEYLKGIQSFQEGKISNVNTGLGKRYKLGSKKLKPKNVVMNSISPRTYKKIHVNTSESFLYLNGNNISVPYMNNLVDDSTLILKRRVHNIKIKFGNAPLARARELALDTFRVCV